MKNTVNFLAFDLGAESGRAVLGRFDGDRLILEEVHRFVNTPVRVLNHLYWDVLHLFAEIKNGLVKSVREHDLELASLGLDTWGVDFALLDAQGALLSNPYHYRDSRTNGMLEAAFQRVPREKIFEQTGTQFMQINTLYQLLSMVKKRSQLLAMANTLLMMPDLFNYWLTGRKVIEYTIASTSQCLNPNTGSWAIPIIEKMGIPSHIFPEIIHPGSVLGELLPSIDDETSAGHVLVVAPGCHDTACAVAAVPTDSEKYAYLSSGTWSLMGTEVKAPIIKAKTLTYNFTNEGGVCDTKLLLKNITGLWLIQECQRAWSNEREALSYQEVTQMAEAAPPFVAVINSDDGTFLPPRCMPTRIRKYCSRTGQTLPDCKGSIARTALESLALRYRWTMEKLEDILGYRLEILHVGGGGSQNRFLNQLVADAIGRAVITGPVEATAVGNVLMQMMALGFISSLEEGRDLVRRSFKTETYVPQKTSGWDEAYDHFLGLLEVEGEGQVNELA